MYRAGRQSESPGFHLPFGGKLAPEDRRVKLAGIVPWHLVEEDRRANFADSGMGAPAKESRIAPGALIIKERLGTTDEETVARIRENACLQYFPGRHEFLRKDLFDPSMRVRFGKRVRPETLEKINLAIIHSARNRTAPSDDPPAPPPTGAAACGSK